MFNTGSKAQVIQKISFHINLIGQVQIIQFHLIDIKISFGNLVGYKIKPHCLLKLVEPASQPDTPIIPLVNKIIKFIPKVVAKNKIKGGDIIIENQAFPS